MTVLALVTALVPAVAKADGSPYSVRIEMDEHTVNALQAEGYFLTGFKAVKSSHKGGKPVAWFSEPGKNLTAHTNIHWEEFYNAYVVEEKDITNGRITSKNSPPEPPGMALGEVWSVKATGFGKVGKGGQPGTITIDNISDQPWVTGISQKVNGKINVLCAFPLHGHNADVIAPIEKVLLLFNTQEINTGTVIEKAIGQSVMIDLTAKNSRSVRYDIDKGWDCGPSPGCKTLGEKTNLAPLLIQP